MTAPLLALLSPLLLSLSPPPVQAQVTAAADTSPAISDATRQPAVHTLPRDRAPLATRVGPGDPLTFEAALAPSISATAYARAGGVVVRVQVHPAQVVAAGDTLAHLEPGLLRLRCELDAMHRDELQARLRRVLQLEREGLVSAYERERLQHEALRADLAYREAVLNLSQLVLTAPISGIVTHVHIQPGQRVSTGQACVALADLTDLQAELPIPMDRLAQVRLHQTVTAHLAPARALKGRILRLAPVIDPDTGCCLALARFPSAGHAVLPGSVARITVPAQ